MTQSNGVRIAIWSLGVAVVVFVCWMVFFGVRTSASLVPDSAAHDAVTQPLPAASPAVPAAAQARVPVGPRAEQSFLTIRVMDNHGQRVSNADVRLDEIDDVSETWVLAAEGRTDPNSGELSLTLPLGDYYVSVNKQGDRAEEFESFVNRVKLSVEPAQLIEIELRRRDASLTVVVEDDAGAPVAGIVATTDTFRTVATTDINGTAQFERLVPGKIRVTIRNGPGGPEGLAVRRGQSEIITLQVAGHSGCWFQLARTGVLELRLEPVAAEVMEAEQVPFDLIYVSQDYDSSPMGRHSAAIGETYRIEHLPPGTYRVQYLLPSTLPIHTVDSSDPLVQVLSGQVTTLVTHVRRSDEVLSGRIIGPDGYPVAGVPLFLHARGAGGQWDRGSSKTAQSGADGNFEFLGLAPSEHHVFVDVLHVPGPASYAYYGSFEWGFLDVPFPVRGLEVQLARGYSLRGYVTLDGVPLARASIAVDRARFDWETKVAAGADSEGRRGYFDFGGHLRAGRYELTVRRDEETLASREIVLGPSSGEQVVLEWELQPDK